MDATLQRLADEAAIRDVLARYARAVDRMDWELLRSCYHADATDVHGGVTFTLDEFVAYLQERLPKSSRTFHFLGQQLIDVEGDVAWAETYCIARHRDEPEGAPPEDLEVCVRYSDRLERRAGEWRLAHRVVVYDLGRIAPLLHESPFAAVARYQGARDRSDPTYRRDRA